MIRMVIPLLILFVLMWPAESSARRAFLTPEQKTRLSDIHTILISAVALSDKGPMSPEPLLRVVREQFKEVGFHVVTDASHAHDVEFHLTCEERKRQPGQTRQGSDAASADTPDRLWHGPACQLRYRLDGRDLGWHKEVRGSVDKAGMAASSASHAGNSVFIQLARELARMDFPVLLLNEWGQTLRLVELLADSRTPPIRQRLILDLFRQFPSPEVLPHLLEFIQQGQFPEEAIGALSGLGQEAVPPLIHLFQNQNHDAVIRAAAAKGLGRMVRANGSPEATEVLLEHLAQSVPGIASSADIDFAVLTEVVWAIGSIHHQKTFQLIETLQNRIWLLSDSSPEMKKLREVVSVVYRYMEPGQL